MSDDNRRPENRDGQLPLSMQRKQRLLGTPFGKLICVDARVADVEQLRRISAAHSRGICGGNVVKAATRRLLIGELPIQRYRIAHVRAERVHELAGRVRHLSRAMPEGVHVAHQIAVQHVGKRAIPGIQDSKARRHPAGDIDAASSRGVEHGVPGSRTIGVVARESHYSITTHHQPCRQCTTDKSCRARQHKRLHLHSYVNKTRPDKFFSPMS
nr:hypothetical protein [Paraburkholderia diazotrophica]